MINKKKNSQGWMSKFLNIFSKKPIKKEEKLRIIVDHRERNSSVVSELISNGFEIQFKQLPVADYLIGRTAIERKTISDFKTSIKNKRIMQQLLEIKQYPSYFLILEGLDYENIYETPGIHENAFRGFLLSTILEFEVPIIFTLNSKDTAKYLAVLARKKKKPEQSIRASKIYFTEEQQLQFIMEGFPQIGPSSAKKLLKHFKTIKNIANASEEELKKVVGKKAEIIYRLLHKEF